jgi:hypothetical protein
LRSPQIETFGFKLRSGGKTNLIAGLANTMTLLRRLQRLEQTRKPSQTIPGTYLELHDLAGWLARYHNGEKTYAELPEDARRCLGTFRLPDGQEGKQKEKQIGRDECDLVQLARMLDRHEAGMIVLEDLPDCAHDFIEKCLELERIGERAGP